MTSVMTTLPRILVRGHANCPDAELLTAAQKYCPSIDLRQYRRAQPGETAPLTALAPAEICRQSDLPPGVLNVLLSGYRDSGLDR